jgi:leucyl-tRNA synthetase
VSEDIDATKFNTAIAQLMTLSNELGKCEKIRKEDFETFVVLFAPFAPHIAEELWKNMGKESFVVQQQWPSWDEEKLKKDEITVVAQVNGKLRGQFTAPAEISREEMERQALALPRVQSHTAGKTIHKVIVVPKKLVNIVAR